MLIKRPSDIPSSEVTPECTYFGRREFIRQAGLGAAAVALATPSALSACSRDTVDDAGGEVGAGQQQQEEEPNSYEEITSYNNYYEFGTDKEDPKANSGAFKPLPWTVRVDGLELYVLLDGLHGVLALTQQLLRERDAASAARRHGLVL